ncbi:hypothetical protein PNOK_0515300 [Pyrrhoderma noxium]|uniref:Uncharacterized protein n=1 Tax=Pyrrhoderma noxium TaxID=2282107 RepID=A0A286UL14_9AGAM|nr:hypothetical protein PNOK_0515300 [Pyrrhoderma noxium]
MYFYKVLHSLSFCIILLSSLVYSEDITIDDTSDSLTYSPAEDWVQGSGCTSCSVSPTASSTHGNSWHDTTYQAGEDAHTITFQFSGIRIAAYFIVPDIQTGDLTLTTNLSFSIDGSEVGTYDHSPTGGSEFLYNQRCFYSDTLSDGSHTLVISARAPSGQSSLTLFDYLVYTTADQTTSSSATTSSSSSAASSTQGSSGNTGQASSSGTTSSSSSVSSGSTNSQATDSTSESDTTNSSSSHTGAIVGGVVGGVAAVLLVVALLFCCRRKREASDAESSWSFFREKGKSKEITPLVLEANYDQRPATSLGYDSPTTITGMKKDMNNSPDHYQRNVAPVSPTENSDSETCVLSQLSALQAHVFRLHEEIEYNRQRNDVIYQAPAVPPPIYQQ